MSLSNYMEARVINLFRNVSGAIAAVHASLHSADPGETGANELAGGGYARDQVVFTDPAGGNTSANDALLEWLNLNAGDIVAVGLWDAAAAGNFLGGGWLGGFPARPFTSDVADVITSPGHGYADDQRVVFDAEDIGTLPTGVVAGTIYWVRDATADTFKVSATQGGAAIDLTTVGSGKVRRVTVQAVAAGTNFQIAIGDLDLFLF